MRKTTRKGKADGGPMIGLHGMHRTLGEKAMAPGLYKKGGGVSAKAIAEGKPAGTRKGSKGSSPASRLATGYCEGKRSGSNVSKELSMGKPSGKLRSGRIRFAEGGHATDESQERFKKAKQRNDILGRPHYATGGKVYQGMKALYHALHSHFENEPQMKKLGATKADVDEGEPHRYASGGHLGDGKWMQNATNPSTKGALHRSLHVPMGKKIPMDKIEKAEHSKSPLLRKRANLSQTFKKYRPQ